MRCSNCNTENPASADHCEKCGNELRRAVIRKYTLKCPNCSASMDIDYVNRVAKCSYCGTKEILKDSDAVEIERIKHQTQKEIELAKLARRKPTPQIRNIIVTLLTGLMGMAGLGHLISGETALSVIALTQSFLLLLALLIGTNKWRTRKKKLYIVFLLSFLVMFVPYTYFLDRSELTKLEFIENEFTKRLPASPSEYGYMYSNNNLEYFIRYDNISKADFQKYISDCKDMGYNIVDQERPTFYEAYDSDDYFVSVFYYGKEKQFTVKLTAPKKYIMLSWPPCELAAKVPEPVSKEGVLEKLSDRGFTLVIKDVGEEEFHNYVLSAIETGYNGSGYEKGKIRHSGSDKDDNYITIKHNANKSMMIEFYIFSK